MTTVFCAHLAAMVSETALEVPAAATTSVQGPFWDLKRGIAGEKRGLAVEADEADPIGDKEGEKEKIWGSPNSQS